nr:uncharacterized protein LOC111413983 [Onthophagus taurus]
MEKANREFQKTRDTHIKKIESLERRSQKKKSNSLPVETIVIIRSNVPLTKDETSVLAKALNYAIAPKKVPKEEIICEVEAAVRGRPALKAKEIRQEVARVLKSAKPPKSNLTVGEKKALRSIKEKSEIIVLPADKCHLCYGQERIRQQNDEPTGPSHLQEDQEGPHRQNRYQLKML